jgi:oxygen-dependent protoporphyrinogen oxidase
LTARLTHPDTMSAAIWSRDALHPMPTGTLMGVPSNPAGALGVLEKDEIALAQQERNGPLAVTVDDLSVGEFISARLGPAVVDRLVEPLLGGVYAGHAYELSLRATLPALWKAATAGKPVTEAAERALLAASIHRTPVFAGLVGGVAVLAEELAKTLSRQGVRIKSNTFVRELQPHFEESARVWTLTSGPVPAPVVFEADALVIAVPAAPAARLLAPHIPDAAGELAALAYASMAIVSVAFPREGLPRLSGSGFLVPPVEGRAVKAATFTSNKWKWVAEAAPDLFILRASLGRSGEETVLQRSDDDLVRVALGDLADAIGGPLPTPVDTHVQRWGGALPQYAVGHVDRVGRIQAAIAHVPALEVAGAAYEGVGIPACIASGRKAADALLTHLRNGQARGPE